MKARVIGAAILVACFAPLRAADAPPPAPVTDSTQVSQHYHEVLARPEFVESEEPDVATSFKERLSDLFRQLGVKFGEFKYANHMPAFESLLMAVLVTLSLAGLLYVMARLTHRRARMDAEPSSSLPGPKTFRPPESYDAEIQQAIAAGDWHAAWLATWRQFLSRLENRDLVEADRTRTNREYLAQLRERNLPASSLPLLAGMVDAYDRFIYGRQSIGEPDWNLFHRQIEEAALLLHLEDKATRTKQGAA